MMYSSLLQELVLHGKVTINIDGLRFTLISAGSYGDYIVKFPDGTEWCSTEYARMVKGV